MAQTTALYTDNNDSTKFMKIKTLLLTSIMLACSFQLSADMTDDQVVDYIKQQTALGKSEQQIGRELVAKGVTPDQVNRIKERHESSESAATDEVNKNIGARTRRNTETSH